MRINFWGVRGSLPVPGPHTEQVGGNTACVSVELERGPLIVLDAGTGIRPLGQELLSRKDVSHVVLLLSHGHWDHIQGFPFFGPAYQPDFQIDVMGCPTGTQRLKHVLSDVMERTHFPVPLDGLNCRITFHHLYDHWAKVGRARMHCIEANHPGGCHGFRIEEHGDALVYLTDNELPEDPEHWEQFVDRVRGARVLIHDSQYTAEELPRYKGWGHSSIEQCVDLACSAGVEILYLFHHDPDRADDTLAALEASAQERAARAGSDLQVQVAREGTLRVL